MPTIQPGSPFDYLLQLETQLGVQSKKVPYQENLESFWGAILFYLGDLPFLVPMEEIVEILHVQALAPIPGVRPWLLGLTTSRGEIFPVTDLQALLTQKRTLLHASMRILVVSFREEYFGILVNRVVGLQRFNKENRTPKTSSLSLEYDPFIIGTCINGEIEYPIMSLRALIQHPKFRDVALKEDTLIHFEE